MSDNETPKNGKPEFRGISGQMPGMPASRNARSARSARNPGKARSGELRRLAKDPVLAALVVLVLVSLTLFIVYPLASVILQGFRTESGWSARVFIEVAKSAYLRSAFFNSIMMSVLTATVGTALGFLFAFAVTRADVPMKKFLNAVAIIPIVSPPFIGALAIIMLFGNSGLLTWGILGMVFAFLIMRKRFPGRKFMEFSSMLSFAVPGTVIGIGYILAFNHPPFAITGTLLILLLNFVFRYIPVGIESGMAVLRQIDPSIEEAAIDLGADARTTFSRITLLMILPAYFSGLVFAFVRAMTAVSAAIFLVSSRWNLMTVQIMSQVESGNLGAAAAFSVILVLLVAVAIALIRAILKIRYGRMGGVMQHF